MRHRTAFAVGILIACAFGCEERSTRRLTVGQGDVRQFILAQSQQSSACNGLHNIDQRLARWLLRLRDATGSNMLHVTQDLMSQMLGVRRTSVTVSASKFQDMGWISYTRGHLKVDRPDALEDLVCECHYAIRKHYRALLKAEGATIQD